MSCAAIWQACKVSQNTNNEQTEILINTSHKMSNKLFIIKRLFLSYKSFCSFLVRREKQSR